MLTKETDYCIRTVLHLARPENRQRHMSVAELAEDMSIPYRFLRKLTTMLVSGGMLESRRGQKGGLRLRREPQQISLFHVLQLTDAKSLYLNSCLEGSLETCPRQGTCRVHKEISKVQTVLESRLQEITFDQLV